MTISWDEIRHQYLELSALIQDVGKFVSPIMLNCYGINIYVIIVSVSKTLVDFISRLRTIENYTTKDTRSCKSFDFIAFLLDIPQCEYIWHANILQLLCICPLFFSSCFCHILCGGRVPHQQIYCEYVGTVPQFPIHALGMSRNKNFGCDDVCIILFKCALNYCKRIKSIQNAFQVERLEQSMRMNPCAISLFGTFTITRNFIVSILSFIFTTEIILLQTAK